MSKINEYMNIQFPLKREEVRDSINKIRTQSLFLELNNTDMDAVFTLKDDDWESNGKVYLSLRRLYMEIADPTEYEFALGIFGSWKVWSRICNNNKISPYVEEWREELEVKLKSDLVRSMIRTAMDEGSKGTSAAKHLLDKGWDKRKAGRPSKEEIEREKKISTRLHDEVREDMARLGLKVIGSE